MRKIILDLAVTLDGFIEGPNGEIDWLETSEDFGDILTDILSDIDILFYGRVSYEKWGNYRPVNASEKLTAAYDLLHSKTKYVFSRTMLGDGNAIFIDSNIEERVSEIVLQPGQNIWLYGGGNLITTFVNFGLVDIFRLAVHPVILGTGKPLFEDIKRRTELNLVSATPWKSGVAVLTYEAANK
ncbi:MAG: dihydrofolate reductase family protein [Bacteroidota bacterium]